MTRILLISGSLQAGSLHTAALRTAARICPPDLTATLFDGLRSLPAFVPGEQAPDAVTFMRQRVDAADALLFSSPQYAGSLPGTLKNLLDWLVDGGQLDGKPVAWLSVVAPGYDEGAHATLETALQHGNATLLRPACIRVPLSPGAADARGIVADSQLHMALADTLQALSRSVAASQTRPRPSWEAYSSLYPVVPRRDPSAFRRPGARG